MSKMVRLPWLAISFMQMVRDVVDQGTLTLTIKRRDDVRTRRWYTLDWTGADGKPNRVEASEYDLLLRRAAEAEQVARMEMGDTWDEE